MLDGPNSRSIVLFGLAMLAFAIIPSPTLAGCSDAGQLLAEEVQVRRVQQRLRDYGYDAGVVDGHLGQQTAKAIQAFTRDAALGEARDVDNELEVALGLASPSISQGRIIVLEIPSERLAEELTPLDRQGVLVQIEQLCDQDLRAIELNYSRPVSIIFVYEGALSPGQTVKTFASNILNGRTNSWQQVNSYQIEDNIPTEPLIIINEFVTSNPMMIVHKLFVEDELKALRYTRAK